MPVHLPNASAELVVATAAVGASPLGLYPASYRYLHPQLVVALQAPVRYTYLDPNYPPGRVRSAAMLQPYAAASIACAIRQIVPACRGYAAHRWGHPSRVSRLARRRQLLTYSLRAPDRLRCHFDRCVVSPRGCAQGALLLATRPGQGRTGQTRVRAPSPGAVERSGRRGRSKEGTCLFQPAPGPSRSYASACVLADSTHGGVARWERGRPRAPAARAGAPSSRLRRPPAQMKANSRHYDRVPRVHGWVQRRARRSVIRRGGVASPLMADMGAFGDGRRCAHSPRRAVAWRPPRVRLARARARGLD